METFAFYLLKSVIWLSGFALVYFLFLKNERYFVINRFFLIGGILSALVLPLITWHYAANSDPDPVNLISGIQQQEVKEIESVTNSFIVQNLLLFLYLSGVFLMIFRIFRQTFTVFQTIYNTNVQPYGRNKLIRTARFQASFSFVSYVFVNPSTDEPELGEIVKHERGHIQQKHWIDLVLFEILCTIQWFNPIIWFYGRLIRQNHEYLADKHALQNSSNPGIYCAALLNQTFGGSIIPLTSSFNYSFNKKRFIMMNHTIQSPLRKLKLLIVLPVLMGIFYAFSTPEYENNKVSAVLNENDQKTKEVVGNITWEGNSVYTTAELDKALGFKKGTTYSEELLNEQLYGPVSDLYFDNGYLFFSIIEKTETSGKNGAIDLTFKVFEGIQNKIRKVEIQGNNEVLTEDILKVIPIKSGELFSKTKLIQSYQALVETGKFDPNQISPDVKPDLKSQGHTFGEVDIVFNVVEK